MELAKRKSRGGVDTVAEYKWPTELRRYPGNLSTTFVTSIDVIAIDYHLLCVFFFFRGMIFLDLYEWRN